MTRNVSQAERDAMNEEISPTIFVILAYCNVVYALIYLLFATINANFQSKEARNYVCMFLAVGF